MSKAAALTLTGNATTITGSTTPAKVTLFNAAPGAAIGAGHPGVQAVKADSRLLLEKGTYRINLSLQFNQATAADTTINFRKGESVTIPGVLQAVAGSNAKAMATRETVIQITDADVAAYGVKTFDDPSAAAGAGKPGGGFSGAGAAPTAVVPLDLMLSTSTGSVVTINDLTFSAERIGYGA